MQFNRDGLDIPDELVRCQKQGNVVFLCGAGVSVDSGMPNFDGLKQYVIDELKADDAPDAPFDELFSWLENKYDRTRIDNIIAQRLTAADDTPTDHHKIIAKLSVDNHRVPRIVTTNFDVLFEKAIDDAKIYEPPTLPQIHFEDAFISGITYLHGRLNSKKYVLSVEDFAKAYMNEGWAAAFLRELFRNYAVVLCGYGAKDVLVEYFIRGGRGKNALYAFASFENEKEKEIVKKRWKELGITPILYLEDDGHTHLWKSLKAWAQYKSEDSIRKYAYLPHPLPLHLQSQVCESVKTPEGAKDFADLDPPTPANWINVFDERGVLQWIESDGNSLKDYQYFFGSTPNMPPRLFHLCRWMAKHVTSPIVVSWLVQNRHSPLHPRLLNFLSDNVEEAQKAKDMPESFEKVWDFLFAFFAQRNEQPFFHLSSTDFLPPSGEQINWDEYLTSIRAELINLEKYTKEQFVNYFAKIKGNSSYWLECLNEKKPEPTFFGTTRSIGEDTDYQALMNIPLAEVIKKAGKTSQEIVWGGDDLRPFVGLVHHKPLRAIAALKLATRKNEYYIPFWRDAISRWNYDKTPPRITRLFHEHLRRLPANVIHHLMQFTLGGWVRDRLPQIAQQDEQYALAIFDDLLKRFLTAPPKQAESSLLNDDGDTNNPPRTLLEHAINSPFGHITEGLLKIFSAEERKEKSGIPSEFARRFEQLLQAPGDGSYHAVCILTLYSGYLHYIDPDWTSEHLFPLFQLTNKWSQSAWNGILRSGNLPSADVFSHLKPQFLKLFDKMNDEWKWEDRHENAYKSACRWVSVLCFHYEQAGVFSYKDAANCLKRVSPSGISYALSVFGDVKEYPDFVLEFIKQALPKELSRQNETTMGAFIHILEKSGEHFPKFLGVVKEFLGKMKGAHLYGFYRDKNDHPIAKKFPHETLELLDIILGSNPNNVPWSLPDILKIIIESNPSLADDRRYERLRNLVARL